MSGSYSKQLITELTRQISVELSQFFEASCGKDIPYPVHTLSGMVEHVLNDTYKGKVSKADLKDVFRSISKQVRTKKSRWLDTYRLGLSLNQEDPKYTFSFYYKEYEILSTVKWESLYNGMSINDLIIRDMERVDEWYANSKAYLISYPLLFEKVLPSYIVAAFQNDLALDICRIVRSCYGGGLDTFFRPYPQDWIERPLFSPTSYGLTSKNNASKEFVEDFLLGDASTLRMEVIPDHNGSTSVKVLDSTDQKILINLMSRIDSTFYADRSVTMDLGDLVRSLHPRPSEKHYKMVAERCIKMTRFNFTHYDRDCVEGLSFNFFDSVFITSGKEYKRTVTATFGTFLYNAIVNDRVVRVTANNYEALEGNLSRIIYYALQKERMLLPSRKSNDLPAQRIGTYDISFFQRLVRFCTGSKRKKIRLISESLDEFVSKQIAIHSYKEKDGVFQIEFVPLTMDEINDFQESYMFQLQITNQ